MTDFQRVVEFNRTFGVKVNDSPQTRIFDEDPKLVKYRLDLIVEEVNELKEAIEKKDLVEVCDALADIIYVVQGAGASFGIDLDKAFDIVHRSNMSKACISEEQAQMTVDHYKRNETRYDSPTYRRSADGKYWVVYNESTGKILKNVAYTPANFDPLFGPTPTPLTKSVSLE